MPTLKQQAEAIAAEPKGAACAQLSSLQSWQAAVQFAQDHRLITPEAGAVLGKINWAENFSASSHGFRDGSPASSYVWDPRANG